MTPPTQRFPWYALLIGAVLTAALVSALRITQQPLSADFDRKPMPCAEDEAQVWTDAPYTVRCIAIDDMGTP